MTETQAAAAGGVTTVLEMPISLPCCATLEVFESRRALGEAECLVNFGLYGAPGLLDQEEIMGMAEAGACAFKIFTHAIPPGRENEFAGLCLEDESDLCRVLEMVKETGRLLSFHAENERLIRLFGDRIRRTGRTEPAAFVESRPPVVEAMAVAELAVLCGAVDTHVHIAHVSCAAALEVLQSAQHAGLPMTGETCPTISSSPPRTWTGIGPFAMIKPPLRTEADQEALWAGLLDGSLLAITTDHSPFTLAEKERGLDDIWQGAIGAPGVEALVPGVMTEALGGRLTPELAVRFLSHQPAQLFDLYPRKGVIRAGSDADIVIYDPRASGHIDSTRWFSKAEDYRLPLQRAPCPGKVQTTLVNGQIVFDDGKILAEPGTGNFVRPG